MDEVENEVIIGAASKIAENQEELQQKLEESSRMTSRLNQYAMQMQESVSRMEQSTSRIREDAAEVTHESPPSKIVQHLSLIDQFITSKSQSESKEPEITQTPTKEIASKLTQTPTKEEPNQSPSKTTQTPTKEQSPSKTTQAPDADHIPTKEVPKKPQFDLKQPQLNHEEEPSSIVTVDSSLMNSMSLPVTVNTQIEAPFNPKAQLEAAISALAAEQQKEIQKLIDEQAKQREQLNQLFEEQRKQLISSVLNSIPSVMTSAQPAIGNVELLLLL